jgi:hypothetical protein
MAPMSQLAKSVAKMFVVEWEKIKDNNSWHILFCVSTNAAVCLLHCKYKECHTCVTVEKCAHLRRS